MKNRSREWSGQSRGGSFGYSFFIFLICKIGIRPAYAFLSLVALYFIPFAPKATKAIWSYNRRVLKYGFFQSIIKLYVHYYRFGQTLIDKIAITNGLSDRFKFAFENYDDFLKILDGGAAVIIGAHVGNWEVGSTFFGDYASKLNVVMFDGEHQKIKNKLNLQNISHKFIAINEGSIESLLRMKQALDNQEYVCFQGDRFMEKSATLSHSFMGMTAEFPQGPFQLASRFKTPVIFYFAMREKGMQYRFIFKTLDTGLPMQTVFDEYITILEEVVHTYPQQWFNFHDAWQLK